MRASSTEGPGARGSTADLDLARISAGAEALLAATEPAELCTQVATWLSDVLGGRGVHVQLWDSALAAGSSGGPGWSAGAGAEMSSDLRGTPLAFGGEVLGEIVVDGQEAGERTRALVAFAASTAASVARRLAVGESCRQSRRGAARLLARIALAREGAPLDRLACMSWSCGVLARESGALATAAEIELLEDACVLHDVGKVAVPDAILMKPGALTAEEWRVMRSHPELGARLIEDALRETGVDPVLSAGRDIALRHHERWDGKGYPDGLIGERIPVPARIVGLAEAYWALTSDRAYRPAWSHERALDWIAGRAGLNFDPQLVAALARLEHDFRRRAAAGEAVRDPDGLWR